MKINDTRYARYNPETGEVIYNKNFAREPVPVKREGKASKLFIALMLTGMIALGTGQAFLFSELGKDIAKNPTPKLQEIQKNKDLGIMSSPLMYYILFNNYLIR